MATIPLLERGTLNREPTTSSKSYAYIAVNDMDVELEQSVSDPILTDPLPAGLVDFVAADYSLVELEGATLPLTEGTATRPFDLGVDVRRNRVVLRALAGDELDTFLVAREVAQLHPAIDIVIVEALSRPTTAIYGGLSLVPDCTGPAFPRSC